MSKSTKAGFPPMIRGSVVVQRRRCGTPTCRCADGEQLHESTVLSYSHQGRNRTVMLAPANMQKGACIQPAYRRPGAAGQWPTTR